MNTKPLQAIVKVGGSLLDWPEWIEAFAAWQQVCGIESAAILSGGGERVEAIRRAQAMHGWSDSECHWKAIEAMSVSAIEVADRLSLPRVDAVHLFESRGHATHGWCVVDTARLLRDRNPLPCNWSVTSDSIAAWLAQELGISRLVLLKSRSIAGGGGNWQSDPEMVDEAFGSVISEKLRVECVNLRQFPGAERNP